MNLREFCQIPGFSDTLLTTFSFDPLFFERIVLADLLAGGATRITVLSDAAQSLSAVEAVREQLYHLGRRYRLVPISCGGSFHPKLCVRLSREGALVACGSCNLTRSGWLGRRSEGSLAGNREIASVFRVLPGSTAASELRRVRNDLVRLPTLPDERDVIYDTLSHPWLDDAEPMDLGLSKFFLTGVDQSLATILASRWQGRQFQRLHFVSGSTDASGAMLRWAHRTFGISEAILHIDLQTCSLAPSLLGDLDFGLSIVGYDGTPRTHLKLAIFESTTGPSAAVSGSPNCSDSAWLRTRRANGNIESVIVYDECDPADFQRFYRPETTPEPWSKVSLQEPSQTSEDSVPTPPRLLRSMELDGNAGRLRVNLQHEEQDNEQVWAVVGTSRVLLSPTDTRHLWTGPHPDLPPHTYQSLFAHVEIETSDQLIQTNATWINDRDALAHAADRRGSAGKLGRLSHRGTSEQYQHLLNDMRVLASTLLDSPEDFADALRPRVDGDDEKSRSEVKVVDPQTLLRSLSKSEGRGPMADTGDSTQVSVSLTGIMRIVFADNESPKRAHDLDPMAIESQKSSEETDREHAGQIDASGDKSERTPLDATDAPTEKQGGRLLEQLNTFVDKLAAPNFASRCTARQLQQAIAFPIAIARFASRGPWGQVLNLSEADLAIERLCELVLRRKGHVRDQDTGERRELLPLLFTVRNRYETEGRLEAFDQIIGDGTLWLILSCALASRIDTLSDRLRRHLILRDIVRSEILVSKAMPEHLRMLAARLASSGEQLDLITHLTEISRAFDEFESHLKPRFNELKQQQCPAPQCGDWLWNTAVGFVRITHVYHSGKGKVHIPVHARTADNVDFTFYINLRWISDHDPHVYGLLKACVSSLGCDAESDASLAPNGSHST